MDPGKTSVAALGPRQLSPLPFVLGTGCVGRQFLSVAAEKEQKKEKQEHVVSTLKFALQQNGVGVVLLHLAVHACIHMYSF